MKSSNNISMQISYFYFILICIILHFTVVSNSSNIINPFVSCLNTHSSPSHPISKSLYLPTNSSYSNILNFYTRNLRFNESTTRNPLLIITAAHISHIQAAILCAKPQRIEMRVRSGGHDFEGLSYLSNVPFFILDMLNFRSININITDESAWVGAGATLGEVYYKISKKSKVHGFPGGMCPTVGLGGHITSGGFGDLMRKYGLAADNVLDATLVDVNGRYLDRKSMGEDLFWAVTGGGAASFGVIVSFKIRLVRVPPVVTFARFRMVYNELQNFTNIVYKYLKLIDKFDDDLYLKLVLDVVKTDHGPDVGIKSTTIRGTFLTFFLGDSEKLVSMLEERFPELGFRKSYCKELSWVDSVVHWTGFPPGTPARILLSRVHPDVARLKRKSIFLTNPIPMTGLDLIFKKMVELETPVLKFFPYGGIMNRISDSAKPFPHRVGNKALIEFATNWNEAGDEVANYYINLTRLLYKCVSPFGSVSQDAYLSYRDLDLGINGHSPNAYSEAAAGFGVRYFKKINFEKLVRIKSKVDPDDFFRYERSIPTFPSIGSA